MYSIYVKYLFQDIWIIYRDNIETLKQAKKEITFLMSEFDYKIYDIKVFKKDTEIKIKFEDL